MTQHLYLVVEDRLSRYVGERLIREKLGNDLEITHLGLKGNGYLRSNIRSFLNMANYGLVILITDLDRSHSAEILVSEWLKGAPIHKNLLFRVAVREIEAWVIADRVGLANYLGTRAGSIPQNPEALPDPKSTLVEIAKKGRRDLRAEIVPNKGTKAKQGLGYNEALRPFIEDHWSIESAIQNSDSLRRAVLRLTEAKHRFTVEL